MREQSWAYVGAEPIQSAWRDIGTAIEASRHHTYRSLAVRRIAYDNGLIMRLTRYKPVAWVRIWPLPSGWCLQSFAAMSFTGMSQKATTRPSFFGFLYADGTFGNLAAGIMRHSMP